MSVHRNRAEYPSPCGFHSAGRERASPGTAPMLATGISPNVVSAPSSARAVLEAYWQIYYIRVLAQSASGGIGSSRCGEVHLSMGVFEILLGGKHASELVKTEASNVTSAQAFFLLLI